MKFTDAGITRREFMKAAATSALAAPMLETAPTVHALAPVRDRADKPNVIVIMLDDLGSIDANCYGAKDLVTPNLDGLAASGTRFTQLYSAAPICSPARAALLTGRYPQRTGLPNMASSMPGGSGIDADEVTMAQMLKSNGYVTGHVGKWHLGLNDGQLPNQKGFDYSFGNMGGCIDNYSHFMYWEGPNHHDLYQNGKEIWRDGENIGDLMIRECSAFIDANKDRPFFLFWAINMPHYPLQGRAKWREYYKNLPSPRSMYAACVSTLDELIGEVLARLREAGLEENTIVVLQSDHGHSTEGRTFGGGGNAGPYRGAKFSLFEGGIRIVSMLSGPGLPKGHVCNELVTGCDWMPTIAELTGSTMPQRRIDGRSMLPVLRSKEPQTQHPVFHWQLAEQWAVRKGDWKLIGNPMDTSHKGKLTNADKLFLSNMSQDVTEMTNIAAQHPEIVGELMALHEGWVEDVKDRS